MCAPSAVSTSRSVARVGLRPSASKMRFEPGKSAAAQRKKAAEEMSPGTVASMACRCWAAGDGDGVEGARDACAERAEGELAVVAGADGFADLGCALRLQSGEEHRGFHLGAGGGRGVVDGGEGRAVDCYGRVAVGEFDARAHLREGLTDALHGAAAERGVADEGEVARLCCEQAGEHAHG